MFVLAVGFFFRGVRMKEGGLTILGLIFQLRIVRILVSGAKVHETNLLLKATEITEALG